MHGVDVLVLERLLEVLVELVATLVRALQIWARSSSKSLFAPTVVARAARGCQRQTGNEHQHRVRIRSVPSSAHSPHRTKDATHPTVIRPEDVIHPLPPKGIVVREPLRGPTSAGSQFAPAAGAAVGLARQLLDLGRRSSTAPESPSSAYLGELLVTEHLFLEQGHDLFGIARSGPRRLFTTSPRSVTTLGDPPGILGRFGHPCRDRPSPAPRADLADVGRSVAADDGELLPVLGIR